MIGTLAVVGLGRMGARIVEAANRAGFDLVAVQDTAEAPYALDQKPDLVRCRVSSLDEVLAARPDVLAVATTGPHHAPVVRAGLDAGIRRFMVEKPFVTGIDEGRAVLEHAARCDARIVVNHGRRFHPGYRALAALDGTIHMGDLRGIAVTMGAGGLGCMGVHYLDLFDQFFGGQPDSVFAFRAGEVADNPRGDAFFDPGAHATLRWNDGRRAVLDICDDTGIPPWLEFRFTYGRVVIENEMSPWRMFHRTENDRALPLTRYGQPNGEAEMPGFASFDILDMCEAALREAASDGEQVSSGAQALRCIETFVAISHAADGAGVAGLPVGDPDLQARQYAIP